MKKHPESHFDHGLTPEQIEYLMQRFVDRAAFFIETVELPDALGTVPCGLYGPLVGDAPLTADDTIMLPRGTRTWLSRLTPRPPRPSRLVTVIAGPHDEHACIVYTMFGGPVAPQEPGDPGCKDIAASEKFWSEHALAFDGATS